MDFFYKLQEDASAETVKANERTSCNAGKTLKRVLLLACLLACLHACVLQIFASFCF